MATKITSEILVDEVTYQTKFYDTVFADRAFKGDKPTIDKNTDGHYKHTIFEHKQNVTSYGRSKALSQALIYLSRFNREGEPVPQNIMLVSQDEEKVYLYNANDYLDIIEDIPNYATMQASKGIDGFKERKLPKEIKYKLKTGGYTDIQDILLSPPEYVKVSISIHNVYGWAQYFYRKSKQPKKVELFRELRAPHKVLGPYIYPWTGEEKDFALIMDLLNDPSQQKALGAFYTPPIYAEKALELVREAIRRVPKGNDYIILDRCAGTGTLEIGLSEEELTHVIVSTYELKEWHALKDRLGAGIVRHIIPPIPIDKNAYPNYDQGTGFLSGADALSKEFLENQTIMQYVNNPNCNVIVFENPPYKDITAKDKTAEKVKPFVYHEFIRAGTDNASHRELAYLFIWSAIKYYLIKTNDSLILFSPVKYFKASNMITEDFSFVDGYLFNRKHFHATAAAISCILWHKNGAKNTMPQSLDLKAYNVIDDKLTEDTTVKIKKVKGNFSLYVPTKKQYVGDIESDVCVDIKTGVQFDGVPNKKAIYNDNIVGYLRATSFNLSGFSGCLTRTATADALEQCYGYYLRDEYFLNKLPLFVAKSFPQEKWYEKEVYFTTSDGGEEYLADNNFLKKCLLWTCLTSRNKCCTFIGSDGKFYRNELCFDTKEIAGTKVETLATKKLNDLLALDIALTAQEEDLMSDYRSILKEISKKNEDGEYICQEYNPDYFYGLFQIIQEIDVKTIQGYDKNGKEKLGHKYGDLHNMINAYGKKLWSYYKNCLVDDLFRYELLK